jgi:hypothetical protein
LLAALTLSLVALLAAPRPAAAQATPAATPATPAPAPAPASAAALVEQGVAAYEEADFDGALAAFDRAEAAGLDRALLVRSIAHRVLIAHASSDAATLETQALRLVSLDPEALRSEASPGLVRALEGARSRADGIVRLSIVHEVADGALQLRARVDGDVAGMVREVRLRARRGDGEMVEAVGGVVRLPGATTDDVGVVADCTGPGGAVLAALGTEAAPHSLAAAIAQQIVASPSDDTALHVGLGVGAAVLVVAAVIIAVVVVDANAATAQLSGPVVEW